MPIIRIEIMEGKSIEYRKAILDGVHKAMVDALKIPDHDRMQRLIEYKRENFEVVPHMTEQATFVDITMFKGRSNEAKKQLYANIVANLKESPGIEPTDVFIVIREEPLENWGIRGGKPASEIDFGFKIDV